MLKNFRARFAREVPLVPTTTSTQFTSSTRHACASAHLHSATAHSSSKPATSCAVADCCFLCVPPLSLRSLVAKRLSLRPAHISSNRPNGTSLAPLAQRSARSARSRSDLALCRCFLYCSSSDTAKCASAYALAHFAIRSPWLCRIARCASDTAKPKTGRWLSLGAQLSWILSLER